MEPSLSLSFTPELSDHQNYIQIYDDFLDPDIFVSMYRYICNKNTWSYGATSYAFETGENYEDHYNQISGISKLDRTMFWRMELSEDKYFSEFIFQRIKDVTGKDWDIDVIYANGATFGQSGDFHKDSECGYTFLIYTNTDWDVMWGGKTIFCDSKNKLHYIDPLPNRGILFPGNILHSSESTTRKFKGLRITTAFKLFPKEQS